MSRKSRVSSKIYGLNSLIFNELRNVSTESANGFKMEENRRFSHANEPSIESLTASRRPWSTLVSQVQRDDFHAPRRDRTPEPGKRRFSRIRMPPKPTPATSAEPNHNAAEHDHVEQQVRQIVSLGCKRVFVPRDVGVVADRPQQRSRFALRKRAGRNHDDRPRTFVEERAHVHDRRNSRLLRRHLVRGVNLRAAFRRQSAAWDTRSASASNRPRCGILRQHHLRARFEIHQRTRQGRAHSIKRNRTQNVLRRVLLVADALRKIGRQRRQVARVPQRAAAACPASSRSSAADITLSLSNSASTRTLPW